MIEQVGPPSRVAHPPDFGAWGAYMGHGGDTYGFLSEQGIIGRRGHACSPEPETEPETEP